MCRIRCTRSGKGHVRGYGGGCRLHDHSQLVVSKIIFGGKEPTIMGLANTVEVAPVTRQEQALETRVAEYPVI